MVDEPLVSRMELVVDNLPIPAFNHKDPLTPEFHVHYITFLSLVLRLKVKI